MHFYTYGLFVFHITLHFTSGTLLNVLQQNIAIDLSSRPDQVFVYKLNLAEGDVIVDISNANSSNGFFVIQAHSFQSNISLSRNDKLIFGSYVIGTNIGMVESSLSKSSTYQYFINHIEKPNVEILVAVIAYGKYDPIPGGCNMVYNTKIAPYQAVTYDDYMIQVDVSPALGFSCDVSFPRLDMYHMYLEEANSDQSAYFNGIENLLTVEGIRKNGRKVSDSVKHTPLRRYYSAYPGTGVVYAVIATVGNATSAYVPAVTYACDINNWDESCSGPVSMAWKFLCAVILFMGVFMCYFGHKFFRIEMFIFGFMFGSFISYIAASVANTLTVGQSLGFAILFGFVYGGAWLILWWRYGIPILSVFVPVVFTGYIVGCIVFHVGISDLRLFQSDLNYWGALFGIIVPVTMCLLFITEFANILSCSMIGATAVIVAVDHYVGGAIHYAILNNIRRATVHNFNLAILDPPFQYKDIILSLVWAFLVLSGVLIQRRLQKGKPPFPPHRSRAPVRIMSERAPLLDNYMEHDQNYDPFSSRYQNNLT